MNNVRNTVFLTDSRIGIKILNMKYEKDLKINSISMKMLIGLLLQVKTLRP